MAMGADGRRIRRMILGEALATTAGGLALGLGAAFAASRWLGTLLFEVSPLDPFAFSAAPLALMLAMLFASYFPAERARGSIPAPPSSGSSSSAAARPIRPSGRRR